MNDGGDNAFLSVELQQLQPQLVNLRRALHRSPELAFHERQTARIIIDALTELGIPYDYDGEGQAVIGRLNCGNNGAPTIALRAEMDALSGEENTHLPFSSQNKGVVHACGHDAHMTMLVGAAKVLQQQKPAINTLLVFQPAEESGGGSRRVIGSGVLDGVQAIFAGHVTHHYALGEIMLGHGVITAQSDRFEIHIQGKGGHGARPHETTDAVIIAASLINTIQTLVSREVDPLHPAVVTIGEVKAGSAANVIAEEAVIRGSIRSTLPQTRERIHRGLKRMASGFAALHDAEVTIAIQEGYPPVVNTDPEVELAKRAALTVFGEEGVKMMDYPSMGSEDFSFYLQQMPGCYVRFGARRTDSEFVPLHSPSFDIDEDVLALGAAFFAQIAIEAAAFYDH